MTALKLLPLIFATLIGASQPKVHENRTVYAELETGLRLFHFNNRFKGFAKYRSGSFSEMETLSFSDFSMQVERPDSSDIFDIYVKKIPTTVFHAQKPLECGSVQSATFLKYPLKTKNREKSAMHSYEYFICAGEGKISPKRLLERYIQKYGNYNTKDYDRNQHIYLNVKKRYEVRVKPLSNKKGEAGLVITVSDNQLFHEVYYAWRAYIRNLEKKAQEKF